MLRRFKFFGVLIAWTVANASVAGAQTVNVTPNQQTTTASAVSNPTGQNISQQNNFYDPGLNAFGPGVQCGGSYLASSLYRNDASSPGNAGSGYSNVGGTIGFVIPINGTSKKCEEFVREILVQRQLDTCMSILRQGFAFDPHGQYAELAKRCQGLVYTGQPNAAAAPVSPPAPPTVITVPANPGAGTMSLPQSVPRTVAVVTPAPMHLSPTCQKISDARKKHLLAELRQPQHRDDALDELHAACITDTQILAESM